MQPAVPPFSKQHFVPERLAQNSPQALSVGSVKKVLPSISDLSPQIVFGANSSHIVTPMFLNSGTSSSGTCPISSVVAAAVVGVGVSAPTVALTAVVGIVVDVPTGVVAADVAAAGADAGAVVVALGDVAVTLGVVVAASVCATTVVA